MRFFSSFVSLWSGLILLGIGAPILHAEPIAFNLPSQPADQALASFTSQTDLNLLYAPRELHEAQSYPVIGRFEPVVALTRLLRNTGFGLREKNGRFFITRIASANGLLVGTVTLDDDTNHAGTQISLPALRRSQPTNRQGEYYFEGLPAGIYEVIVTRNDYQPLKIHSVEILQNDRTYLEPHVLRRATNTAELAPVIVEGRLIRRGPLDPGPTIWGERHAGGNLDIVRTSNDALPFTIYDRDRIARSGVVSLNQFLQRELIDTDATARPPEQDGNSDPFSTGSSNLSLRGFSTEETIVLVNGRRLPEVLTASNGGAAQAPDVNFIPLSLVQQVQVLPASASALYSGNAVGGVINILLRPDQDQDTTEISTTYTNATDNFDAAYSSLSLLHTERLLDGKLRLRLNANFVKTTPATEAELDYHSRRLDGSTPLDQPLYLATPNIRSQDGSSLFPNSAHTVTSVPPGADGSAGLAAFTERAGQRSDTLFDSPGTLASSLDSIDYPYGRRQQRSLYFLSALYEAAPWIEFGLDAAYSQTTINRGYQVFRGDLLLTADNPLNPFGQSVLASLNEIPIALGQNYNEAQLDFYSIIGSALIDLPADWKVILDAQYAQSVTRYRGINEVDRSRWQSLVDRGLYNPLRDTQVHAPPPQFYDEVLIYNGGRDRFVTVGDYETIDSTFRLNNESLHLPTGDAVLNLGADYRISSLAGFVAEQRFGNGDLAQPPNHWEGRTIERISFFGELQAPVVPREILPSWLQAIEADLAMRYIMADSSAESNLAPTLALKLQFNHGLTFRSSFTTSNRFPTPFMSRAVGNGIDVGTGVVYESINDPRRNETYDIERRLVFNPDLRAESAVTQSAGLIFETGERHRIRASLDFFDTSKTNEIVGFGPNELINLEAFFPTQIDRAPLLPGDSAPIGKVTTIRSSAFNLARRHSQNWQATFDYIRDHVFGGTFDLRSRLVYFQKFERQLFKDSPVIDEIRNPSGSAGGLLEYRATFGGGWSNEVFGLGLDGQYFHSRRLPTTEWFAQGARTIDPFWQFDAYLQTDIGHWVLPADSSVGLRGQLRVDNLFARPYPYYASEPSDSGVQPYGDWRGRTYSLSLTAEF